MSTLLPTAIILDAKSSMKRGALANLFHRSFEVYRYYTKRLGKKIKSNKILEQYENIGFLVVVMQHRSSNCYCHLNIKPTGFDAIHFRLLKSQVDL